jgi:hypothetical protein
LGLTLCIARSQDANCQSLNANAGEIGIRHAIVAAVGTDHDAASAEGDGEATTASVDVVVRIFDYASDYRFYGVVDGKFSGFDLTKGAAAQEIWADRKCHENRGYPRIWVLSINGRVARGGKFFDIAARPRHIGELVPRDEIVMQKDREMEFSNPNQSLVTFARTTESRLSVKLTLNATKCRLNAN